VVGLKASSSLSFNQALREVEAQQEPAGAHHSPGRHCHSD
jgi:hypothetical protein